MSPGTTPKAKSAHQAVALAIKAGELRRQPCEVCGESRLFWVVAHHEDYDKPLDVRWFCHKHHIRRHRELDPTVSVRRRQTLCANRTKRVRERVERTQEQVFITCADLAQHLDISIETVKLRQAKGLYPAYRTDRPTLYTLSEILAAENGSHVTSDH
jgi:hypothetical protein